jgi:hypothetical protein
MNNATEEKHILGIRGLNIEDCNKYADVINAKCELYTIELLFFTLILEQLLVKNQNNYRYSNNWTNNRRLNLMIAAYFTQNK